jgi:undecaprenyl pyrophosphate phosphatase UppP
MNTDIKDQVEAVAEQSTPDGSELAPKKKRKRPLDTRSLMDLKLLITMLIPVILVMFVWRKLEQLSSNTIIMATLLFLNGLILYIPQFLPSCNKDCRTLSRVEGLLMGIGGALSAFPGISGIGASLSVASVTGVERKYGLNMILLMNMGVLAGKMVYDVMELLFILLMRKFNIFSEEKIINRNLKLHLSLQKNLDILK